MRPRNFGSDDYRADRRQAQKSDIKEKAITSLIWPLPAGLTAPRNKITPPCACQLCGLVAFLLLSIAMLMFATVHAHPSENLRALLGPAPPVLYLNIALAAYIVTEIFYIILRTGQDASRKFALKQLGFYLAFYFFFWTAGVLQEHFTVLAVSGIILQAMESFRRAQSCKQSIRELLD